MTISENFNVFKTDFLEIENLFQKTRVAFLAESTKIESATFPYKTAISEANVKTNRLASTWAYLKISTLYF